MYSLARQARPWLLTLMIVGCSNENESSDGNAAGSGGQNMAGGGTDVLRGAGGAAVGGTATNPSATGTGGTNQGQVLVTDFESNALGQAVLLPAFRANVPSDSCPRQQSGSCTFAPTCSSLVMGTAVGAGTVTLSSGKLASSIAIVPEGGSTYVSAAFAADFVGGDSLHVEAAGADAPAFEANLIVPERLVIDAPAADASGQILASSAQDLVVDWSRGARGVTLSIQGISAQGSLYCNAASELGSLTIPSALLTALGSGTILSVWTTARQLLTVGSWRIEVGFLTDTVAPAATRPASIRIR